MIKPHTQALLGGKSLVYTVVCKLYTHVIMVKSYLLLLITMDVTFQKYTLIMPIGILMNDTLMQNSHSEREIS